MASTRRIPTLEERAAELAEFERQAEWDALRDMVRTSAECIVWCLTGLLCLGLSFHTTDPDWGRIAFLSGLIIGNTGITVSLYCAYHRAVARGDVV